MIDTTYVEWVKTAHPNCEKLNNGLPTGCPNNAKYADELRMSVSEYERIRRECPNQVCWSCWHQEMPAMPAQADALRQEMEEILAPPVSECMGKTTTAMNELIDAIHSGRHTMIRNNIHLYIVKTNGLPHAVVCIDDQPDTPVAVRFFRSAQTARHFVQHLRANRVYPDKMVRMTGGEWLMLWDMLPIVKADHYNVEWRDVDVSILHKACHRAGLRRWC